jgi:hypothetical protein
VTYALEVEGKIKFGVDQREIEYGWNIVLKIADGVQADLFCGSFAGLSQLEVGEGSVAEMLKVTRGFERL